jgi:aspartyl-tRNA(Asn)/glutamyl-tRNA(Gln) amidotransferase subunit C
LNLWSGWGNCSDSFFPVSYWAYLTGSETRSHTDTLKVTEKDVAYVAYLGNLELTGEERERMLRDLNSILEYIDRLNQLDTSAVQPMAQVSDRYGVDELKQGSARFAYASREDVHEGLRMSLPHEEALKNAPESDGIFFKVPKVIER